jgi:hypothetical protein
MESTDARFSPVDAEPGDPAAPAEPVVVSPAEGDDMRARARAGLEYWYFCDEGSALLGP